MAILTIEGDIDQLKIIAKTESGRAKKYNLSISLEDNKKGEEIPSLSNEPKLTAKEVIILIEQCESLEDLNQYEEDKRQHVVSAYKKKSKELKELE